MNVFLDTSVLVPVFYGEHEHHDASFALFIGQEKTRACTAAHCLAEVYSILTGMPGKNKASPDEALLFLENIRERLTLVALDEQDYGEVLEQAASQTLTGGAIYDAIIARCALKGKAEIIYSWNVKHFSRVSQEVAARVKAPANI